MNNFQQFTAQNTQKTWVIMGLFFGVVILIGWFFARAMQSSNILYGAVFFALAMNFVSYWYSDKIALAMSRAKEIKEKDNPDLFNMIKSLARKAELPMPRVYIIEDQSSNAFATGRNKYHAAVAVTRGILSKLDPKELEGVLAHELGHIGNKDILLSTVVVVLVGFISILADFFMRWSWFGGGRSDDRGNGSGVFMIIGIVIAILAPIAGTLVQLAISRKRELLADATGAHITRNPDGLANALIKISQDTRALQTASNATAHLFIVNPFKGSAGGISKLFMTHPPVEERVKNLKEIRF